MRLPPVMMFTTSSCLRIHRPEFILISTEVKGYRLADHRPTEDAYRSVGDTFLVDYVRVYESV